jgi:hypothetical protein
VVLGKLDVPQVVDDELLARKIRSIDAYGPVRCCEENLAVLRNRLVRPVWRIRVIPAGHHVIDRAIVLDTMLLNALPARKLYSSQILRIGEDVSAAQLAESVDSLRSEQMVICPRALGQTLADKCDMLEDRVVLYDGSVRVVSGEETLRVESLEFIEGPLTLVVTGELTIDDGLSSQQLADHVAQIINLGEIYCRPAQIGAIQARLTIDEGEIIELGESQTADAAANIGYLAL